MNLGNKGPLYLNSVLFFTAAPSVMDASLCYTDAFFRNEGLTPPLPGGLPAGSPRLWLLRDGISWRQPPWPSGASLYPMTDPQRGVKSKTLLPYESTLEGQPSFTASYRAGGGFGWGCIAAQLPFLPSPAFPPFAVCWSKDHYLPLNQLPVHFLLSPKPAFQGTNLQHPFAGLTFLLGQIYLFKTIYEW